MDSVLFDIRRRRRDEAAHKVFSVIAPLLPDDPYLKHDILKALLEDFHKEGIEMLSDHYRQELGLPPRGPEGWTESEIHALEMQRLEVMTRTIKFEVPKL